MKPKQESYASTLTDKNTVRGCSLDEPLRRHTPVNSGEF